MGHNLTGKIVFTATPSLPTSCWKDFDIEWRLICRIVKWHLELLFSTAQVFSLSCVNFLSTMNEYLGFYPHCLYHWCWHDFLLLVQVLTLRQSKDEERKHQHEKKKKTISAFRFISLLLSNEQNLGIVLPQIERLFLHSANNSSSEFRGCCHVCLLWAQVWGSSCNCVLGQQ